MIGKNKNKGGGGIIRKPFCCTVLGID